MANALLQDLSAATTLAGTDLFYVKQSGARGVKATGTQLLALVGTAYVPLAGGTMTGALTISNGATTVLSADLSGYLRVGGVTTFEHKGLTESTGLLISSTSGYQIVRAYAFVDTNNAACIGDTGRPDLGVSLGSARALQWSSSSVAHSATADIYLYRDAAGSLAQRNGTAQQSFSVYNSYTDSSNYERLKLTGVAGTSVNITAETLGTGAANLDVVITPKGSGRLKSALSIEVQSGYVYSPIFAVNNGNDGIWATSAFVLKSTAVFAWGSTVATGSVDAGFGRNAAGIIEVTNGTANAYRDLKLRNLLAGGGNGSYVQTPSMTVDSLADAATAGAGARAFVTDANATTFLSTVAGGGSNKVPVVSDGTNWLIG